MLPQLISVKSAGKIFHVAIIAQVILHEIVMQSFTKKKKKEKRKCVQPPIDPFGCTKNSRPVNLN